MLGLLAKLLVGAAVLGGGTAVVYTATQAPDTGVVVDHVDGDTLDVRLTDGVERIRLLNIDTPETVDPNEDVQCLGPEASALLARLLPVGTEVSLRYDDERTDSSGRSLAAVYTGDVLVNAEIARAGLGMAKVYGSNDTYFPEVLDAQTEAQAAGRGLYSSEIRCTLPAKATAAETAAGAAPTAATTGPASELAAAVARADQPIAAGTAFLAWAAGDRAGLIWEVFDRDAQDRMVERVSLATDRARSDQAALRSAAGQAREREQADAARVAEEHAAAQRRARAQAAADEAARDKAARDKAARERVAPDRAAPARAPRPGGGSTPSAPRSSAPSGGSGSTSAPSPYPGYTGPRCYAPGGKTWKPC